MIINPYGEESNEDQEINSPYDLSTDEPDKNQEPQSDLDEVAGTTEKLATLTRPKTDESIPNLQEKTRAYLAKGLIWILGGSVLLISAYVVANVILAVFNKDNKDNEAVKSSKDLIILIWTSEVTLVSGALGFYFGSKGN